MTKFEVEDMKELKRQAKKILKENNIKAFMKDIQILSACTESDYTVLEMEFITNGIIYSYHKNKLEIKA